MRQSLYDYCLQNQRQELLNEWDDKRNLPFTPDKLTSGSSRKMWWHCKNGHIWQAAVYSRTTNAARCPYCSGRRVIVGENDLKTVYPQLAAEWDMDKNRSLPSQVRPGSHQVVWWKCRYGHSWQASVCLRTSGSGCPVCANRKLSQGDNDLASTCPEIAAEWDHEKNEISPSDVLCGSNRRVWWKCARGHSWNTPVNLRVRTRSGCPYCAGKKVLPGFNDLASQKHRVAVEWDTEKNGTLRPDMVTVASNLSVWWICPKGHSYRSKISSRTSRGSSCPYCAGKKVLPGFNDLQTLMPLVAMQWHPTLNAPLTPSDVTSGSSQKVWWQCPEGHVWKAVISSRTGKRRCGCPVCAGRHPAGVPDRTERKNVH